MLSSEGALKLFFKKREGGDGGCVLIPVNAHTVKRPQEVTQRARLPGPFTATHHIESQMTFRPVMGLFSFAGVDLLSIFIRFA